MSPHSATSSVIGFRSNKILNFLENTELRSRYLAPTHYKGEAIQTKRAQETSLQDAYSPSTWTQYEVRAGGESSAAGGFPTPWRLANPEGEPGGTSVCVAEAARCPEQRRAESSALRGFPPLKQLLWVPPVEATALGSPRCSRSVSVRR
ncbi:hypothetical protein [Scytonema millei]|uniref:Uncharacterized protein n=1 Tax=Tolypothrix bouteillei VB521301 TaxID=1479485 RepID=A0A0C1NDD9_9CYAN